MKYKTYWEACHGDLSGIKRIRRFYLSIESQNKLIANKDLFSWTSANGIPNRLLMISTLSGGEGNSICCSPWVCWILSLASPHSSSTVNSTSIQCVESNFVSPHIPPPTDKLDLSSLGEKTAQPERGDHNLEGRFPWKHMLAAFTAFTQIQLCYMSRLVFQATCFYLDGVYPKYFLFPQDNVISRKCC